VQPVRVQEIDRVSANICICVDSAPQSNEVAFDVFTDERIVVAVPVLAKSGLCVVVLAWEAQVVG
jgi:hypothetical protein